MSNDVRQSIIKHAVSMFSLKGFYGVSIRDIAKEVGCSIPMLYYYFKNKEDLFYDVCYKEYVDLNKRLTGELEMEKDIVELYVESIYRRVNLKGQDRQVFTLALKTRLGANGDLDVVKDLRTYEKSRFEYAHYLVKKYFNCDDPIYGNIIARVASNIVQKSILYGEVIDKESIHKEISKVFDLVKG